MATADQVKALVRSHAEGDDERFFSVALQVAARAARGGRRRFAQDLKDLVDEAQQNASLAPRPIPVSQPSGELASLLTATYPNTRMADLVVEAGLKERLDRVILEHRQQHKLREHGFDAMRRLLLIGPPGTGKTMTASALAGELHLPLFTIRLDGLITKFMGETAAKLRLVFDSLQQTRGVYLFDEVDALAGERARSNDVGEIRRVLNSFLQFLESEDTDGLLVAATNHPQLLDTAIFRRFDAVIEYPLPNDTVIRSLVANRLANVSRERIRWKKVLATASGLSHSEITLATERAAKNVILSGRDRISSADLVSALEQRRTESRQEVHG